MLLKSVRLKISSVSKFSENMVFIAFVESLVLKSIEYKMYVIIYNE